MKTIITFCALGLMLVARPVAATIMTVQDAGFENVSASLSSPTGFTLGSNSGAIGAWSGTVGGLLGFQTKITAGTGLGGPGPAAGNSYARITMPIGAGLYAYLSQTLQDDLEAQTRYTLSVRIDQGATAGLLGGAALELRVGGATVASLSGATLVSLVDATSGYQTISLTYETGNNPVAGDIGIFFGMQSSASLGGNIYLDNFQLSASPIPEPVPVALICFAGGGLLVMGYRKWRAKSKPHREVLACQMPI